MMMIASKLRCPFLGKAGALSAVALAAVLLAPSAHAQLTFLQKPTQLSSDDLPVALTLQPQDAIPNPYVLNVTGWQNQTVTFTNNSQPGNGNSFNREAQPGLNHPGLAGTDFLPGTQLLRNVVKGNNPVDALTITFAQAVNEVGFNFEPTVSFASTDFTFTVFQAGSASPTTIPFSGITNFNGLINGSIPPFFGVESATNNITSITISGVRAGGDGNDFFIGDNFTPADPNGNFVNAMVVGHLIQNPVPEPGAMAVLAGAILPLGLLALRRRRG